MGRGNVNFFVAILERGARESGFRGIRALFLEHPLHRPSNSPTHPFPRPSVANPTNWGTLGSNSHRGKRVA